MQIRSRTCARESKSDDRPNSYAGTFPLETLKAIISIAAIHKETFLTMHIDVSRAYFQRSYTATFGRQDGHRRWERRTDEERHIRNKKGGEQLGT